MSITREEDVKESSSRSDGDKACSITDGDKASSITDGDTASSITDGDTACSQETKSDLVSRSKSSTVNTCAAQSPYQISKQTKISPKAKAKAVMYMSLSMAVHFAGHEFARAPTTSMFTSSDVGFQSAAALPLAVGFVSPFSIFLLWVS